MKKALLLAASALLGAGISSAASADVVSLNFEGINATYPSGYAFINDFYNGGTSSDGTSGTNYGISFSDNAQAICLNTPGVSCSNTSRGGVGDPNSAKGGLFFLSGDQTYLNDAAGFTDGFSVNYVSYTQAGSISVYDGLNGTGNLLGTLALSPNATGCDSSYGANFCPFSPTGINFSGIAKSISFAGVANQIVFDDVTFGSSTPGGGPSVPEPGTWALMIAGFGLAGGVSRRRRARDRQATMATA